MNIHHDQCCHWQRASQAEGTLVYERSVSDRTCEGFSRVVPTQLVQQQVEHRRQPIEIDDTNDERSRRARIACVA